MRTFKEILGKVLCRLGFHRWSRERVYFRFDSHVKEYEKVCLRCGKVKRWFVPV